MWRDDSEGCGRIWRDLEGSGGDRKVRMHRADFRGICNDYENGWKGSGWIRTDLEGSGANCCELVELGRWGIQEDGGSWREMEVNGERWREIAGTVGT